MPGECWRWLWVAVHPIHQKTACGAPSLPLMSLPRESAWLVGAAWCSLDRSECMCHAEQLLLGSGSWAVEDGIRPLASRPWWEAQAGSPCCAFSRPPTPSSGGHDPRASWRPFRVS